MTSSIKTDQPDISRQSGLSSLPPDQAVPVEETQVRRFEQLYRQEGGNNPRREGSASLQAGSNFGLEGSGSRLEGNDSLREGSNFLRKDGDFRQEGGGIRQQEANDFRPEKDNFRLERDNFRPEGDKRNSPADEKPVDNSLSSLMSSLMSERLGVPAPMPPMEPAAVAAARTAAAPEGETLEKLVQQILVARPEETGHSEVRLRVQDGLLPDTEIRLTRGADGLLSVTLSTGRDDAFQTLVGAQSALKDLLNAQEKQEVRLTVVDTRDAQGDGDAGGRRSRGLIEDMPDEDAR